MVKTANTSCPECMKNGIYLSRANVYVCKYCGTIYPMLSSAQHLMLAREIKILKLKLMMNEEEEPWMKKNLKKP